MGETIMTTQTRSSDRMRCIGLTGAVLALTVLATVSAHAETTQCTEIASLPATLTEQGVYCLKHDLLTDMTSGSAITIANNSITIDFNGFKLGGAAAGIGTQAIGVYANDHKYITLRNGVIRGFQYGVYLGDTDNNFSNTGNHRLYNLTLDSNTATAIYAEGTGNLVYNNRISNTGGSPTYIHAYALWIQGPNASITGNIISKTSAGSGGGSYGIVSTGGTSVVRSNEVTDTRTGSDGSIRGIWVVGAGDVVEDNAVLNQAMVAGSYGITSSSPGVDQNVCLNNKLAAFSTAIINCKNGGGNIAF